MTAVCVFCASSTAIDRRWLEVARAAGAGLATRGHVVISGGGSVGMMGKLAAGARGGGAYTLGVIPQVLVDLEVADSASDELVVTDGMSARKTVMIERAQAFLVLPGGIGTLDELFEVWTMAALGMHNAPIILASIDGFFDDLVGWLTRLEEQRFLRPKTMDLLRVARTLEEALEAVDRLATASARPPRASRP